MNGCREYLAGKGEASRSGVLVGEASSTQQQLQAKGRCNVRCEPADTRTVQILFISLHSTSQGAKPSIQIFILVCGWL